MYKRVIYNLCLVFLFIACQEMSQETSGDIVVEGWIESGGYPVVMLSRTFVVSTGEETYDDPSIVLSLAKVEVSDGIQSVILTGDYDEQYFPPFIYSTSKIRGVPGRTYYLRVEYEGQVITAETTIPEPASLEALEVSPCAHLDSIYQIVAHFEDNPETKDYYLFLTRIFNRENRFYPSTFGVIDDEALTERNNKHVVHPGIHMLTSDRHTYGLYFLDTDLVQIKFARIDETTYNIHKAYHEMVVLNNNPLFASDLSMPTNIQGGLGFWCGYAATRYNVVIADSIR